MTTSCATPRSFLVPFFTDSTCPRQLGLGGGLVARYRSLTEVCAGASTLRCSSNPDSRLCVGTNVRVTPYAYERDSPAFNGSLHATCEWKSQPLMRKPETAEWVSVPRLVSTRLKSDKIHPKTGRLRPSEQEKLLSSLRVNSDASVTCDSSTYPTMVAVRRLDPFNPFHAHEDFLALWTTFVALDLDPCECVILLTDVLPNGYYLDMWRTVFAPRHGIMRLRALTKLTPPPCLKKVVFAVEQRAHFEFRVTFDHYACSRSPWLVGFRRFVLSSFGLGGPLRPRVPNILLLSRQRYMRKGEGAEAELTADSVPVAPGRGRRLQQTAAPYTDATRSVHSGPWSRHGVKWSLADTLPKRGAQRLIANEAALISRLSGICNGTEPSTAAQCVLRVVDPSRLPMAQQLEVFSQTDVLRTALQESSPRCPRALRQ